MTVKHVHSLLGGQPVLFILVWLVCSRTGCQHNLFFPLLPEVMDVKKRFYVPVGEQFSDLFAASNSNRLDEDVETVTS